MRVCPICHAEIVDDAVGCPDHPAAFDDSLPSESEDRPFESQDGNITADDDLSPYLRPGDTPSDGEAEPLPPPPFPPLSLPSLSLPSRAPAAKAEAPAANVHRPPPAAAKADAPTANVRRPTDPLIGRTIDNRYRIMERIDAGKVGAVYLAEHVPLKRRVAVKMLLEVHNDQDDYVQRFEREALAASKLSHPACVAVLDYGRFDGRPYLVMEYVEGRTLAKELKDHGALMLAEAVLLTRLILEALEHTHELGVIHRDIKPPNIMLCDPSHGGARLRILDFGLAKSLAPEDPAGRGVTRVGAICGTPGYIAPEQAAGAATDARSDLYSVGAVLFTMVCGRRPFHHEDGREEMRAHLSVPPLPAHVFRPEVSPELEQVIAQALEKEPGRRFQTAAEFIAALSRVPEAERTLIDPAPPPGASVPGAAPGDAASAEPATAPAPPFAAAPAAAPFAAEPAAPSAPPLAAAPAAALAPTFAAAPTAVDPLAPAVAGPEGVPGGVPAAPSEPTAPRLEPPAANVHDQPTRIFAVLPHAEDLVLKVLIAGVAILVLVFVLWLLAR